MFSFYWPWAVVLLPLPLLVWWLWPRPHGATDAYAHSDNSTLLHPALGRLASTFVTARSLTHAGNRLQFALLALLWALLVLALMQPQWLEPYTEIRTEGYDLMLAVDTSRSMEALDFTVQGRQVTRMAVIKGVLARFIKARDGDRIGIVVFGSQAYVLSPMTLDMQALHDLLDGVVSPTRKIVTELATLEGPAQERYPPGTSVKVLIRPDDIVHDDNSLRFAKIKKRTFRGESYLYTLVLPSGNEILTMVPSHHDHAVGEDLGIKLEIDHLVVFPVEPVTIPQ